MCDEFTRESIGRSITTDHVRHGPRRGHPTARRSHLYPMRQRAPSWSLPRSRIGVDSPASAPSTSSPVVPGRPLRREFQRRGPRRALHSRDLHSRDLRFGLRSPRPLQRLVWRFTIDSGRTALQLHAASRLRGRAYQSETLTRSGPPKRGPVTAYSHSEKSALTARVCLLPAPGMNGQNL